jgi:hypothetical protein
MALKKNISILLRSGHLHHKEYHNYSNLLHPRDRYFDKPKLRKLYILFFDMRHHNTNHSFRPSLGNRHPSRHRRQWERNHIDNIHPQTFRAKIGILHRLGCLFSFWLRL